MEEELLYPKKDNIKDNSLIIKGKESGHLNIQTGVYIQGSF